MKLQQLYTYIQRSTALHYIVIILLTLLYVAPYFSMEFGTDIVSGWDGAAHLAMMENYAHSTGLFSWIPQWSAGMIWPLGYPPLMSVVFKFLFAIFPMLQSIDIFRVIFFLCTLSIPLIAYWIVRRLEYSKSVAFLSGVFALFFLVTSKSGAGVLGISMAATFGNGTYSQLFAAIPLFLWIGVLLGKRFRPVHAGVLLGIVLVSNIHMAQTACIILAVYSSIQAYQEKSSQPILKALIQGCIALGLSAFWWAPLFESRNYFLTQAMPPVDPFVALSVLLAPLSFSALGVWHQYSLGKKEGVLLWLSGFVIACVSVLPLHEWLPFLPLQPFRLLPVSLFLCMILAPSGIMRVVQFLQFPKKMQVIACIVLVLPFAYWHRPITDAVGGQYALTDAEWQMVSDVQKLSDSRSLIEYTYDDTTRSGKLDRQPTQFILSALIGGAEHETISSNFRESSLSTIFTQPLRNSFSEIHETFGVYCWLCHDEILDRDYRSHEFYSQPLAQHLKRSRFFGVKYLIIRSDKIASQLRALPALSNEKDYADWSLFSDEKAAPMIEELTSSPLLVFTDLKSTRRPADGPDAYDWLRINEEWFFHAQFDQIFTLAPSSHLDSSYLPTELEQFSHTLLVDYSARDVEEAYVQFEQYARHHRLYLLSDSSDLYQRLALLENSPKHNIYSITRTGDVRADMKTVLDQLRNEPIEKGAWFLLRQSYFPWWKEIDGGSVYMASPTFTAVHTAGAFPELQLVRPQSARVGMIISTLVLLSLLGFSIRYRIQSV